MQLIVEKWESLQKTSLGDCVASITPSLISANKDSTKCFVAQVYLLRRIKLIISNLGSPSSETFICWSLIRTTASSRFHFHQSKTHTHLTCPFLKLQGPWRLTAYLYALLYALLLKAEKIHRNRKIGCHEMFDFL